MNQTPTNRVNLINEFPTNKGGLMNQTPILNQAPAAKTCNKKPDK